MRGYIQGVFSTFIDGNQQVGFHIEQNSYNEVETHYLSPNTIRRFLGLEITDIELLIGHRLELYFYKSGEIMANGEKCNEDSNIIKDFLFILKTKKDTLRSMGNSFNFYKQKRILTTTSFERNSRTIIKFDIGTKKPVFIYSEPFLSKTKLNIDNLSILEGSYISPYYYEKSFEPEVKSLHENGSVVYDLRLRMRSEIYKEHFVHEIICKGDEKKYIEVINQTIYSKESNNWLEDAAGSDDSDVMNDTYWNID